MDGDSGGREGRDHLVIQTNRPLRFPDMSDLDGSTWSPEGEEEEGGSAGPNSNTNRLEGGISRKGEDMGRNMPDIASILSCQDRLNLATTY